MRNEGWLPSIGDDAIRIRNPAVFPDKFPFSFGNSDLMSMSAGYGPGGWLDNARRLDWTELFVLQEEWCSQPGQDVEQEPYVFGSGPSSARSSAGATKARARCPLL